MKINQHFYPYNIEARKLPVHLTGIGGSEWQAHIVRTDGYKWHQIFFSAEGDGVLKYDNISTAIEGGTFFFLPAGYPHEYYTENDKWDVRWVTFDGYSANHILSLLNMTKPTVIKPHESDTLQMIFDRMFTAQISDKIYCDFICSGLIYEYIIEFHRHMNDKANKVRSERSKMLLPVLNYIDENFSSDFSMTVLAELAGVSPQHLCRIFKDAMNMRPGEYLTQRRLQESRKLLRTSELSVSEVALCSGYSDAAYFSTVFKKSQGMTPMEYRRAHVNTQGADGIHNQTGKNR